MKGSYIGTCVPTRDIPRYVELYRAGKLPVDRLMSGQLSARRDQRGLRPAARGQGGAPGDRVRRMNPFDYSKALTDFWSAQGEAWMKAQDQAARAMADGMQAVTGALPAAARRMPDLQADAADMTRPRARRMIGAVVGGRRPCRASWRRSCRQPGAERYGADRCSARSSIRGSGSSGTGEMDEMLGRMAEGPRLADLWQIERRYARVLQAWMGVRRRALEHNAVVLQAWLQAGRRFAEELAAADRRRQAGAGRASRSWRCGRRPPTGSCSRPSAPTLPDDAARDAPGEHGAAAGAAGAGRALRQTVRLSDPHASWTTCTAR